MGKKQSVKNYIVAKRAIDLAAKEHDITSPQLELLLNMWATGDFTPLDGHPGNYSSEEIEKRSMEAVQKMDGRSPPSISADLTVLSRDKGYVEKGINPYSQKSRYISITVKGDELCRAVSEYFV